MAITWDRERLFDLRTVKRHVRSGSTSQEELDEFVAGLPDASENIRPPEEGGDDDGYDEDEDEDEDEDDYEDEDEDEDEDGAGPGDDGASDSSAG
jgi:hypothetical protein